MKIQELPSLERPREKAELYGVSSLSNRECFAILLRHGYKGHDALSLADDVLRTCGGMGNVYALTMESLCSIKGISKTKAIELLTALELGKRLTYEAIGKKDNVNNPRDLILWLEMNFGYLEQEIFAVIFLDVRNHVIGYDVPFKGGLMSIQVYPRELFKKAILCSAAKVLFVHNHPSGDLVPSKDDLDTTKRLIETANIIGIPILDHVIVSKNQYFSIREKRPDLFTDDGNG